MRSRMIFAAVVFVFLSLPAPSIAAGSGSEGDLALPFIADDYAKAITEARARKLPIFMDVSTSWCHTCRSMEAFVFTDPSLARFGSQFVWLEIDAEKPQNAPIRKQFPVPAYPTFFIIDPKDETVVIRLVGAATAPQLAGVLEDGRERMGAKDEEEEENVPAAMRALERADRAYGAGKDSLAVLGYRQSLSMAPENWAPYGRAVESLLFSLEALDSCEAVIRVADQAYPKVRHLSSGLTAAASGLDCALQLPKDNPARAEYIRTFEARAKETVADMSITVSADDRSSVYGSLIDARDDAGDEAGKMETAGAWAAYLEKEAAAAATREQRNVFDAHRLSAYLTLNQPERAIPMLEESEKEFPNDYNPPARLAVAYKAMKDWDKAVAASDRALLKAYGPRKLGILQTRSDIFMGMGDRAKAREAIEEAVKTAESFPPGQRSESAIASLKKKLQSFS